MRSLPLLCCSAPSRKYLDCSERMRRIGRRGASLAAATVRGLILTVSHKEQIGELYPQVLEALVYGACRELFE